MDWHENGQELEERINVKFTLDYMIHTLHINIGLPTNITIWPYQHTIKLHKNTVYMNSKCVTLRVPNYLTI